MYFVSQKRQTLSEGVKLQSACGRMRIQAVLAGAGIGFISRRAVEGELAGGALAVLSIEGLAITRRFYALQRQNQELPLVKTLWAHLLANGREAEISVNRRSDNR